MKRHIPILIIAASLVTGLATPVLAEEPATPATTQAPVADQPKSQPSDVPRPALVPAKAEPAAPLSASDVAPRRHRHDAHHYRHGYDHAAYFPAIYWPRNQWPRIHWQRIVWPFRFG